ncbi:hypothetical protein PAPYR_9988 [Paratrimastix pyriformis]|uniref:Uncharacterized protein n=1 Tax=Paratrimastix pyriformis TaxID=342808 RepID=A0ABQ8U721_9EUKA|nr:hypothetical protein PAPYR_9988 [Paratrimastix pyriformis]
MVFFSAFPVFFFGLNFSTSGATIIIYGTPQGGPPPENQITLENLLAPRMRSAESTEEPYTGESRDFLRRICVGKQVRFQITRPGMQPGRDYGSVFLVEGSGAKRPCTHCEAQLGDPSWHDCASEEGQRDMRLRQYRKQLELAQQAVRTLREGPASDDKIAKTWTEALNPPLPNRFLGRAMVFWRLMRVRGREVCILFECLRAARLELKLPGKQTFNVYQTAHYLDHRVDIPLVNVVGLADVFMLIYAARRCFAGPPAAPST